MATVDPQRALVHYQARVGELYNGLLMRDLVIQELEEQVEQLESRVRQLQANPETVMSPSGAL